MTTERIYKTIATEPALVRAVRAPVYDDRGAEIGHSSWLPAGAFDVGPEPSNDGAAGWIQTATGRQFRPLNPDPLDVDIEDIAHALSNQCRFTGHVRQFYSVAQHSYAVSRAAEAYAAGFGDREFARTFQLAALLHDASEAYLVDLPSPVKRLPEMASFRAAEARILRAIEKRFGLPEGLCSSPAIKALDRRMLATEARDLMAPLHPDWPHGEAPFAWHVVPLPPDTARGLFLNRFAKLGGA